jgi:prolyl oligopeptidase
MSHKLKFYQGVFLTTLSAAICSFVMANPTNMTASADSFQWLEDANASKALDWVKLQNGRSLGVLQNDPRYAGLYKDALAVVTANDRVPVPGFLKDEIVTNFWQDSVHVRGLLRMTSLANYKTNSPVWENVLDIDALSKVEKANWVYKGIQLLWPDQRLGLVNLSNGGKDAVEIREFNLNTCSFVSKGFHLPEGKQDVTWIDVDTLAVSREWELGTLTESGYPFIVKILKRGQALADAKEIFRGNVKDVSDAPYVLRDNQTSKVYPIIHRAVNFFESESYLLTDSGAQRLNLPKKVSLHGVLSGQLLITLLQDWKPSKDGLTYRQGSLVSVDFASFIKDPAHALTPLYVPGPRETISSVGLSQSTVVVTIYNNVKASVIVFSADKEGKWIKKDLKLAENSSIDLVSASDDSNRALFSVTNYLTPSTLWLADLISVQAEVIKTAPSRFDASNLVVEQFEAASSDGVKIPYFIVRPRELVYDGNNPALLYAYGGFQVSMTPQYSGTLGKLWLEKGGVYVLANIRGGGEFGPAWHEAGLKTHRQIIYDDFVAVAHDLISRKITSPRRLGIEGGSNGGLLMGVQFTQHPELWNAVVIQVPLLDMLRFDQIGAGASWVAEYGSPKIPTEAKFLRGISPYHNLDASKHYPEPFFVTSTKDDRVSPAHARKMAAKMESMGLPFYYYENTDGGHAAAANLQESAKRVSLEMTYLTRKLFD